MIDWLFFALAMLVLTPVIALALLWLWGFAGHVGDEIADAVKRAMDRWHL